MDSLFHRTFPSSGVQEKAQEKPQGLYSMQEFETYSEE